MLCRVLCVLRESRKALNENQSIYQKASLAQILKCPHQEFQTFHASHHIQTYTQWKTFMKKCLQLSVFKTPNIFSLLHYKTTKVNKCSDLCRWKMRVLGLYFITNEGDSSINSKSLNFTYTLIFHNKVKFPLLPLILVSTYSTVTKKSPGPK